MNLANTPRASRLALAPLVFLVGACADSPQATGDGGADYVLRGGVVMTAALDAETASAIAVSGDRVLAVGSDEDVAEHIGSDTRVIELDGRLVTPGFNDAHLHFASGGVSLLRVDLNGTTSLSQIEERVRAAAEGQPAGTWIQGRGWDHTRLPANELGPGGWPTKDALDRAAPNHPVYLNRVDGHTGWGNSIALREAGITADTPDPEGGEIVRDEAGEPTGIFKENAEDLVASAIPATDDVLLRRGVGASLELAARTGVTSATTSASFREIELYRRMADAGELTIRLYAWVPLTMDNVDALRAEGVTAGTGDAWLRTGILKGYSDGTLGSRTAWMLEPFTDDPSTSGIPTTPRARMDSLILAAHEADLQLAIHAIGDGATRTVLDGIEAAREALGPKDLRHRIEHAQIIDAADIPRFAELGVIASMQPTHATSDLRWAEDRVGRDRAVEGGYAWRSLLDSGARIAFGTDFAVEPLEPVQGLYSAVTRQSREEPGEPAGGWLPEQRLTFEEAVRLYTAGSAYGEFQEDEKGALEAGMLADLVIWDRDLSSIPPEEILVAAPDLTMVGGRVAFER
ncbi:MAG: amidohydrolase [Gemmatimonadota bacterium]